LNIILFQPEEVEHPLPRSDARAWHILNVLRLQLEGIFDAGVVNGPRGKGTLKMTSEDFLTLSFSWGKTPPPLCPIHLLIGLPRPQTARDILRDATTLGVAEIHFIRCDRNEPSYSSSSLWKSDEWRKCVINGAAQAFCTRLPEIIHHDTLAAAIYRVSQNASLVALDNYEASISLVDFSPANSVSVVIALGSERGWSSKERLALNNAGFTIAHLGPRVLRTETACIAAVSLIKAKLGLF
jgi:16S rRNA (uracil1498-N3)-methyltransferase